MLVKSGDSLIVNFEASGLGTPRVETSRVFYALLSPPKTDLFCLNHRVIHRIPNPTSSSGERTCECLDWLQRSERGRSRSRGRWARSHGVAFEMAPGHLSVGVKARAGGEVVGG